MDGPHGKSAVPGMPWHSRDKRPPSPGAEGPGPARPLLPVLAQHRANAQHLRLCAAVPDLPCRLHNHHGSPWPAEDTVPDGRCQQIYN